MIVDVVSRDGKLRRTVANLFLCAKQNVQVCALGIGFDEIIAAKRQLVVPAVVVDRHDRHAVAVCLAVRIVVYGALCAAVCVVVRGAVCVTLC